MESGRVNDLIKFFKYSGIYSTSLITSIVNRFANKLNNFYGIEPEAARLTANMLIPDVLQQLVLQSKNGQEKEFALGNLLSKLNGNRTDLSPLVNSLMVA